MQKSLVVNDSAISLDAEGYLQNLDDWNPDVAEALAVQHDIELTPAHWQIIEMLRRFHDEHEIAPAMRILVKLTRRELGPDKGNSIYLLRLFPGSPAKIAALVAGLPRPTNCL